MKDPALDAIAAEPELVKGLDQDALFRLALKAQSVQTVCMMAMLREREVDDTLTVEDAARIIGISANTLSHRAKKEPYRRLLVSTGTRRLAFSRKAIEAWQSSLADEAAFRAPSSPTPYSWLTGKRA